MPVTARATEPQVLTRPLAGTPLTRAMCDPATAARWTTARPETGEAWRARADRVAAEFRGGEWLPRLTPALGVSERASTAATRLARVAAAGGVVVTTGQQPGLFGGPIYTWAKALSALALADAVQDVTGIAAAPVFWAATDDGDFAEA